MGVGAGLGGGTGGFMPRGPKPLTGGAAQHTLHALRFTCLPAGVDAAHAFPQAVLHALPELTVTRTTAVMAWTGAQHGTGKVMGMDRLQLLQRLTSFAACCGVRLGC